ncbi:MAG: hypothetical protein M9921_03695 [Fimbriimonadaceae bacterium]|nr:hypothetical protein [Fimbriimonadaceae bacterium]
MGGFFLNLRSWWETADRTQRAVTLFGSAFLVLLLGGTFYFASRPHYEMLVGGLTPAEQAAAVSELQQMGLSPQTEVNGAVLVPSNRISEARQRLAASGKLPASGHLGVGSLDNMGVLSSPRVERERLKAVLEGQIATAIEKLDGVAGAQVNLTLGDDTAFVSERQPATGNVTLIERAGGGVGFDQAKSIARLVANSVQGLDIKNVSIINQGGQTLWDGAQMSGANGGAAHKIEAEITESRRREREIQSMLDAAFGPGNTVAKVNLELDFDKSSIVKNEVLPTETPIVIESNKETMNGSGGTAGGPAGADGAVAPVAASASGDQGYKGEQQAKTFGAGQMETRTEKSAGNLLSMAITVLADQEKIKDAAPIQNVLDGYLGSHKGAAGFTATVQAVEKFDRTAQAAAQKSAQEAASAGKMQQIFSLLPILALVAMGFVVIKAIAKTAKSGNVMVAALPSGGTVSLGRGGEGGSRSIVPSDGAARHAAAHEEELDIENISTKVNRPLESIKRMSDDKPEVVAMLIKGWLLEERL